MPNANKKEALNFLKRMDKSNLIQVANKYMSGGGFGNAKDMTKPQIIKILMSGKTSYYKAGGVVKKKKK